MRSVLLLLMLFAQPATAYESDQFSNRTQPVADSAVVLDKVVNETIDTILGREHPPTSEIEMARAIYYAIGGHYWADRIERWAARSPQVEKYDQTRYHSIYRGIPIWASRVIFLFGTGRTFRVNDVMVGSDKFGHFVSQGYKYYKRERRGESAARLLAKGRFAERYLFGQLTTGVFSNADLVANYEGWRFYQSLFSDGVVDNKPAILAWDQGRIVRQRPFTWADHINAYWDEALNPSYNVPALNRRLRERIRALCPAYREHPAAYSIDDDKRLWQKYSWIGLKDNRENQFQRICSKDP